jgi:hypothetical protein
MRATLLFAIAASLAAPLPACATRPQLCRGATECRAGLECVAGMCEGAPSPLAGSRRIVLSPSDIAVVESGAPAGGSLPSILTLGRAMDRQELLLRFDLELDRSATILRASVMLDRSDAIVSDPAPVSVHAERVIGRWDPRLVTWATTPAVQDVRSPRTVVLPAGPARVRIDVTDIARRWLSRDAADHGVVIVAENTTPTGVAFALGSTSLSSSDARPSGQSADRAAPRLEVYVR